ncbi:MAG: hypothetical protein QOI58_2811 [Thermoanaerobaculia bacterium]|jgi:hypothetical protein|nr:hypothetical protein [Thermoanaerobaculia bacterium]
MNMNEFRSNQPLSEEDFAEIRWNVMTTIATRKRFFPIAMRLAFAAALVIAIGIAWVARRPAAPVIATKPVVTKPPIAVATIAPSPVVRVAAPLPRHRRATHPRAEYAAAPQEKIRVEFRTSDPDVRIIWIASQTPSTTSGGKS